MSVTNPTDWTQIHKYITQVQQGLIALQQRHVDPVRVIEVINAAGEANVTYGDATNALLAEVEKATLEAQIAAQPPAPVTEEAEAAEESETG